MAKKCLLDRSARRVEFLGQRIEGLASCGVLAVDMREPFTQGSAELPQPRRMFLYKVVPFLAPEPPNPGFFDRLDCCRTGFTGEQRHFAEPIARPEDRKHLGIARAAIHHDLHGAGLDQVKGVALIALANNRLAGAEHDLFQFPEHFGDVFAGKGGEYQNAANSVGKGFHDDWLTNDFVGLLEHCRGKANADEIGGSIIEC